MASEKIFIKSHRANYFPRFDKPEVIGYWSVDQDGKFCPTTKSLKYLKYDRNKISFDLNIGFEQFINKPETIENEEKLNNLLLWLNREKMMPSIFNNSHEQNEYTFISYRGALTTIMRTPYETRENWIICATKIRNAIFLCAFYSDAKKATVQGMSAKQKLLCYGGFKFEQYMFSEAPDKLPNTSVPVNANEEFCLVLRSKLNKKNLLYGAEIDGIESDTYINEFDFRTLNKKKFVELKTTGLIQNRHTFERYKLLRWWCQSFMVGIEEVLSGFRDDEGIVRDLRKFQVQDMPNCLWSAHSCMQFLDSFLESVAQTLKNEPDFTVWRFDWTPSWNYITKQKLPNKSEYEFLPYWFVEECKHCFE